MPVFNNINFPPDMNTTIDEEMIRRPMADGNIAVRKAGPTAEHPYGRQEFVPLDGMTDPLAGYNQHVGNQQGYQTAASTTAGAINYEGIRRGQEAMMAQMRANSEEGFNAELSQRIYSRDPDLKKWINESAYSLSNQFDFIMDVLLEQMTYGSGRDNEPETLCRINDELNQLERNKMDVDK